MADQDDYRALKNRWPLTQSQRGSPELDALIRIAKGEAREEIAISRGDYYTSSVARENVPSGDITYRVLRAGDLYQVIEALTIDVDYSQLGSGAYTVAVRAYLDTSDGNSFEYDDSVPLKFGRNLNGDYINKRSELDIFIDALTVGPTGDPDYTIYYAQFFIDSQGNSNTLTGTTVNFFNDGRKIIIPPNGSLLLETVTSGDAAGTVSLFSNISWSEATQSEV